MRSFTSLTAKPDAQPQAGVPKAGATAQIATCQRDLVAWSLLVCPRPQKARRP
jgi:hypothetical protein